MKCQLSSQAWAMASSVPKKLGFNDINSDKWIFKTFPFIVALN